ncbi:hypothetical protein GUJ93_ZPchr0008g12572 [Zizania palustris]|uniref:Uncharacterized protein n=1 Tax=Zizania palustris TaxID=103762 RepID=A0A8J5V2B4_ZIZPA|nr:hypothetical protein GUJ93_ZPchr0008g12572 [Zizania palustris]
MAMMSGATTRTDWLSCSRASLQGWASPRNYRPHVVGHRRTIPHNIAGHHPKQTGRDCEDRQPSQRIASCREDRQLSQGWAPTYGRMLPPCATRRNHVTAAEQIKSHVIRRCYVAAPQLVGGRRVIKDVITTWAIRMRHTDREIRLRPPPQARHRHEPRYVSICRDYHYLLLTKVGLGRLVAKSEDEYVNLALDLASDVTALQELRMSLRGLMTKSPVCDGENFTRGLESAYRNMWRRYCDGDVPALRRLKLLEEQQSSNDSKQDSDDNQVVKLADLKAHRADGTVHGDKQPLLTANAALEEVHHSPVMENGASSGRVKANGHRSQ